MAKTRNKGVHPQQLVFRWHNCPSFFHGLTGYFASWYIELWFRSVVPRREQDALAKLKDLDLITLIFGFSQVFSLHLAMKGRCKLRPTYLLSDLFESNSLLGKTGVSQLTNIFRLPPPRSRSLSHALDLLLAGVAKENCWCRQREGQTEQQATDCG